MTTRKPKLETKLVQQALAGVKHREFLNEVNALLLDGWRVVPGTYYYTRVKTVAREGTPAFWVTPDGDTFKDHYFIVLEREEVIDPDAARRAIEAVEGRRLAELAATCHTNGMVLAEAARP